MEDSVITKDKEPKSTDSASNIQGRTLGGGGVGGCNTPPSLENCKKSVQNSFKIVEKVGPVSRSRYLLYFNHKNKEYIQ